MESLGKFISEYETIIKPNQKIRNKQTVIHLVSLGILLLMVVGAYFLGILFNSLKTLEYLVSATNIIILITYGINKYLTVQQFKKENQVEYSTWLAISLELLYVFITLIVASLFMIIAIYLGFVSLFFIITYSVLFIAAMALYMVIFKRVSTIVIPAPIMLIVNGLFIGILFYSLTMLIHINNIPLSFVVVLPTLFALILIKQYVVERFVIRFNRVAIVLLGFCFVILSFPFSRGFTYASIYRGEFTFKIVHETLANPVKVLPEGVTGEVVFHDDYIVVVGEEDIQFYDDDLNLDFKVDNDYSAVYTMNGELLANLDNANNPSFIELFKLDGTAFVSVGSYYVDDPTDKVYLGTQTFLPLSGYVYERDITGAYTPLTTNDVEDLTVIDQEDDFLVLKYPAPYFAASDTFRNSIGGYTYKNVAYHNGHFAFICTSKYIRFNPNRVVPEDRSEVIIYLAETTEYFDDDVEIPIAIQLPELFKLNDFYFFNGNYYLTGYVSFTTQDFNHMVFVYNDQGEFVKNFIFEGPNLAISEDYIAYGNDEINLYSHDIDTSLRYRIIEGYSLFFTTLTFFTLFSIERIQLKPKQKRNLKINT